MNPVVIGISGASGAVIAQKTVEALLHRGTPTAVVCTNAAKLVWRQELDEPFGDTLAAWMEHPHFVSYGVNELAAPIASGTYPTAGMAMVPGSMATVASLAHGMANNLLLRAADVCLKERRKLVIMPRETPLHAVHLQNLTTLANLGAVIMPPEPPFYLRPTGMAQVVDYFVRHILVALELEPALPERYIYHGDNDDAS